MLFTGHLLYEFKKPLAGWLNFVVTDWMWLTLEMGRMSDYDIWPKPKVQQAHRTSAKQ